MNIKYDPKVVEIWNGLSDDEKEYVKRCFDEITVPESYFFKLSIDKE